MIWIKKYGFPGLLILILVGLLVFSFYYLKPLNLEINTIIGLLFSVPITLLWLEYNTPVLQIKKDSYETVECGEPVRTTADLSPSLPYECIRIPVENNGRSAAIGCKCYIIFNGRKERISWTVPIEDENRAFQIINVNDIEYLDFCAFKKNTNDKIYTCTEGGWPHPRPPVNGQNFNLKLLITSENAKSVSANIEIDNSISPRKINITPLIFFLDDVTSRLEKVKKRIVDNWALISKIFQDQIGKIKKFILDKLHCYPIPIGIIFTLFLFFILAQNYSGLHDYIIVIEVFGVLAFFWILILFFMTVSTTFFAIMLIPAIYKSTCRLGMYHILIQNDPCKFPSKKLKAVLKENFFIGIFLFVALIYIFNSVPSSFFANESCGAINTTLNQSLPIASQNSFPQPIPDAAFTLTLIIIPTFLLSLRLFANPTDDWITRIINCQNLTNDEKRKKIRFFKEQVISFFYSFIVGTLILVYLSICFTTVMIKINNVNDYYRVICPFIPKMDQYSIIFFSVLEIIIVVIITMLGEWYLKNNPPIDRLENQIPPRDQI